MSSSRRRLVLWHAPCGRPCFWLAAMLWAALAFLPPAGAEVWTLERALAQALTNNPDARLAGHRLEAARAGIEQANAALWPRIQFQSGYTRTDNPMLVFGSILNQRSYSKTLDFNSVPDVDDLNVRGVATLPLYTGGRTTAERGAARAGADAARLDAEAIRSALAFEVVRAFHTVLKTREFIRAAEATVQAYSTNLGVAQARVANGSALKTEALDIEVRLAQAREDVVRARNANALAVRALRNLLGITESEFEIAASAPPASAPATGSVSSRAELCAAQARLAAAEQRVRAARSGRLPRLSAFGSIDYDYGPKLDGEGRSYSAGALLQWDLWDGQLTRARIREAQSQLEIAREEERKLRLQLDFEAEQARLDLNSAGERLAVSERVVAQATESADLTRSRFGGGAALATQLIDAETALLAARVRRVEAEADKAIAVAALRKALGQPQLAADEAPR